METTTIVLVRHGHVEGIEPARFRGHHDLALTSEGQAQAHALADRLAAEYRPSAMYTSPLRRCLQTAKPIAAACSLAAVALDSLIDFDYGDFTWKVQDDVRASDPLFFDAWQRAPQLVRFPNGDAIQDVVARGGDVIRVALDRHPGETVLFVTHDAVIRCVLLQLLDMPIPANWLIRQDPCALNEVTITGTEICVRRVNDHR
jgi:phosphoserine phosphatase